MPPRPGDRLYADYTYDLPVAHGLGEDRHLLVTCRCGRKVVLTEAFCRRTGLTRFRMGEARRRLTCGSCGKAAPALAVIAGPADMLGDAADQVL